MNTHDRTIHLRPLPFETTRRPQSELAQTVRVLTSNALFQGEREIGIHHAGSLYRLKITRQGKLILNK